MTKEILLEMEEYKGKEPTGSSGWVPFTLDELLVKVGDREYDDIRVIAGVMGSELDVFRGETWLFSIIKYGGLYYVRKVNLPYEKYMAYITALRFPIATSLLLAGWFWKHNFEKYGKVRALSIVFVPIFVWWLSGLIPVVMLEPGLIFARGFIVLLLTLYLGVFFPFMLYSYYGILTGLMIFIPLILLYKWYIYPKYEPDTREDEFDFIEEKLV